MSPEPRHRPYGDRAADGRPTRDLSRYAYRPENVMAAKQQDGGPRGLLELVPMLTQQAEPRYAA